MSMHDIAFDAKQLCRTQHSGVLGSHSTSMPGYPFGSVVPFFLTPEGNAVIYISEIALHTRNIKANCKVSLTIFDAHEDDSQANGRVTIMGDAEKVESPSVAEQYMRLFPQAKSYQHTHDFNFYEIKTERVRYIGGFGKIHWVGSEFWRVTTQDWHLSPEGMIEHMNMDHLDAMSAILMANCGIETDKPKMLSVFPEGAHYGVGEDIYYVPFEHACETSTDVRKALVAQTHGAREKLGIEK